MDRSSTDDRTNTYSTASNPGLPEPQPPLRVALFGAQNPLPPSYPSLRERIVPPSAVKSPDASDAVPWSYPGVSSGQMPDEPMRIANRVSQTQATVPVTLPPAPASFHPQSSTDAENNVEQVLVPEATHNAADSSSIEPSFESTVPPSPSDRLPERPDFDSGAGISSTSSRLLVAGELPWWQSLVARPLRPEATPLPVDLEQLIVSALNHSYQIKVFSKLPQIRETAVGEADAAFDWIAFLNNRWDDVSDPVGSSLTVGGNGTRFNDHNLNGSAGLRRQTRSGAQVEMSQRLGWQDNNSNFFVPAPQGTSRLTMRFTQPLLRGRGADYNNSLILLAQIDRRQADDEYQRQLQGHLLEVVRSYWELYLERGVLLQKLKSYQRAAEITRRLELRAQLDASETQLVSAQATLAQRRSELFRAQAAVVNAESKIRALVNAPQLDTSDTCELIPSAPPSLESYHVDMQQQRALAIQCRPEVAQAIKQIKSASVRLKMSKHELLPVLNLVTEAYVSGLQGQGDIPASLSRQFDTGAPSYGVGLEYELPIGNRTAKYRNRRRMLELRQLNAQYQSTLSTVQLEVEVAVRELQTSQRELAAKHEAQQARTRQLQSLTERWHRNINDSVTGSFALENLLDAQDRVTQAEFEYLQSQLTFNLSIGNLNRATGTLLESVPVHPTDGIAPQTIAPAAIPSESDVEPTNR
ncbi:TolC family protein [Rosistilla ulvae]|uniref:TolC family protein n=1 Tax=Rosistilla ulvae TaxID=1930277 RepID=UPI001C54ED49|nr:TolC family protein [Rosistilla ulvae]